MIEAGGKSPPFLRELEEQTGYPVFQILDHLTFEGRVAKVTPDFYISRRHFEDLLGWITERFVHFLRCLASCTTDLLRTVAQV